jgi:hypothetical protein
MTKKIIISVEPQYDNGPAFRPGIEITDNMECARYVGAWAFKHYNARTVALIADGVFDCFDGRMWDSERHWQDGEDDDAPNVAKYQTLDVRAGRSTVLGYLAKHYPHTLSNHADPVAGTAKLGRMCAKIEREHRLGAVTVEAPIICQEAGIEFVRAYEDWVIAGALTRCGW